MRFTESAMNLAHEPKASAPNRVAGRPRDPRVHAAILHATFGLLQEVGYGNLTIEGIAARAGVGKATIYRRWRHKGLLVFEALLNGRHLPEGVDIGSFEDDLRHLVDQGRLRFATPQTSSALLGVLADFGGDGRLRQLVQDLLLNPLADDMGALLERAGERGELRGDFSSDVLVDAMAGALLFRSIRTGDPIDEEFASTLADLILRGSLKHD